MTYDTSLRINTEKLGDIRDIIQYLQVIEKAYNHLYAFDFIISDAKLRHKKLNESSWGSSKPVRTIPSIRKPEEMVLPDDRIQLTSIVIKSPGFWEFLGNINPLEVIRKYLCDRHERKKDEAYRNQQEKERGELENEKLRTQIVQEKIKVLKNLGVPEEKIRKALFEHVIKPLGELDAIQDKRLVVDAEIIEGKSSDHSLDDSRKF
jgi:NACalpha-BTF3-like transcription factor